MCLFEKAVGSTCQKQRKLLDKQHSERQNATCIFIPAIYIVLFIRGEESVQSQNTGLVLALVFGRVVSWKRIYSFCLRLQIDIYQSNFLCVKASGNC